MTGFSLLIDGVTLGVVKSRACFSSINYTIQSFSKLLEPFRTISFTVRSCMSQGRLPQRLRSRDI
jgi:hypothetical protein